MGRFSHILRQEQANDVLRIAARSCYSVTLELDHTYKICSCSLISEKNEAALLNNDSATTMMPQITGTYARSNLEEEVRTNLQSRKSSSARIQVNLRPLQRALSIILPILVAVSLLIPTLLCIQRDVQQEKPFGCDPAGSVWIAGLTQQHRLSIWSLAYILNPTIPLWQTSFRNAKAIDLCWDVFVGRGYSALSAILVYRVFRTVLADTIREHRMSQQQILAMEYDSVSLQSLWVYTTAFVQRIQSPDRTSNRIHITMLQLMFLVTYVLLTPTWLSAMTSYQAVVHPMVKLNGTYVPFETLVGCRYHIYDGSRIGLTDDLCVQPRDDIYKAVQECRLIQTAINEYCAH